MISTSILSVAELKTRLDLKHIIYEDYSDNDLETLITLTIQEIENRTGLPISEPRKITEYHKVKQVDIYVTDYYNIIEPSVTLNEQEVPLKHIDQEKGILYFTTKQYGDLKIEYNIQYNNISILQDLITNMITLKIEGDNVNGQYKSIKEGDVSVTIAENNTSLYEKVDNVLDTIAGYCKPRIKIL